MIAAPPAEKKPIPSADRLRLDASETFQRREEYERRRSLLSRRGYTIVTISPKARYSDAPSIVRLPKRLQRLRLRVRSTDFIGWYEPAQTIGILFTDISQEQQSRCGAIFREKLTAAGFGLEYEISMIHSWSTGRSTVVSMDLDRPLTPAEFANRLREEHRRYLRDGVGYTVSKIQNGDRRAGADRHWGSEAVSEMAEGAKEGKIATWSADGDHLQILLLQKGSTDDEVGGAAGALVGGPRDPRQMQLEPYPPGGWRLALEATRKVYENDPMAGPRLKIALVFKRLLDIAGSAAGLLLGAPLFLILAAGVKLSSPGPVLFRQKRVGQYGREFTFLKFRSMKHGNDSSVHEKFVADLMSLQAASEELEGSNGKSVYKMVNDSRITRFGAFIRKTSLDELPQLINVLRGEMSLVGPRPPIPYEVDLYAPWHLERLAGCKPGITGLWQVEGRSRVSFNEMVRMDLRYAREWSLWFDIQLLIRTVSVVLKMTGAR